MIIQLLNPILLFTLFLLSSIFLAILLENLIKKTAPKLNEKIKFETLIKIQATIILIIFISFSYWEISNFNFERKDFNVEKIKIHSKDYYKVTLNSKIKNNTILFTIKNYSLDDKKEIYYPKMYQKDEKVKPKIITNDLVEFRNAKENLYFGKETKGSKTTNENGKQTLYMIFPVITESEKIKFDGRYFEIIYDNTKEKITSKKDWQLYYGGVFNDC